MLICSGYRPGRTRMVPGIWEAVLVCGILDSKARMAD